MPRAGAHALRRATAVVTILAALVTVAVALLPARAASADPAAGVLDGAQALGTSVTYPDVAAGGGGLFHGVVRDSSLGGTRIVYLRSTDAGRTWRQSAVLSGTIAATRPSIAADGDHLAVGFVGDWTDGAGAHGEAPYLTTSDDGGASWTPARRLGTWATDVDVAVDGDRVWVIWGGSGGIRGTTDGGATFFASADLAGVARGLVAAGDGVVSAAYLDGAGDTWLAVGQGHTLSGFERTDHAVLQDVAAADGLAYVLVADAGQLSVLASSPGGAAARAHVPAPPGAAQSTDLWADLAAGRGTVAVAMCTFGTAYVSESTDWPDFAEPTAVTSFAGGAGQDCRATIAASAPDPELQPRFDWSVAPHYVDTDGDGLPEPANVTGTSVDNVIVGDNAMLRVTLDGCASLPAGGGIAITRYIWSVNGDQVADLDHCAGPTIDVDSGQRPQIRLEIRDDAGGRAVTTRTIAPRDLVVVSLGDSVASGEGSPLRPKAGETPAAWSDASCHRSAYAGPALAARQLEEDDPHTAVTFVQLACSGAAVVDTFDDPAHRSQAGDPDDPVTGGVDDAYAGVAHAETCETGGPCPTLRPSQLSQMRQLLGSRTPDAVLVSIGANDVRFSDTLMDCLAPVGPCQMPPFSDEHDARMTGLPARYQQLADGLTAAGVSPDRVHISEYFDPTGDSYGLPDLRCIGRIDSIPPGVIELGLVNDDEATWARDHVVAGLNAAVHAAASAHGWDVVGGIPDRFARHGYCADDPWIVRIGESLSQQGDRFGSFHPNRAGQEAYGDAIHAHLASLTDDPTPSGGSGATGAASVGDLVVLASDPWSATPELRSVALTTTGGRPVIGATRTLQSGPAWGAVALDASSSVAIWAGSSGGYAARLGARPNVAVRDVRIVQAPADGSRLVTDRKTAVMADLWSSVDGSATIDVTTSVVARDGTAESTVLAPVTEHVLVYPGSNEVLLPVDDVLAAADGSVLVATVKVKDPDGAAEEDAADNELSTAPGDFVPTMQTRPVRIAFVPLDFGGGTVSCGDIATSANVWVAWAQQLLPVPDGGVVADLSCLPEQLAPSASEVGVAQALGELDLLAREAGLDSVVGVVPDHWLGGALGDGSVGRAGVTGRSILLEKSAPETALAHELGHNLGLDHTEPDPASGAWVSRNKVVRGTDFMAASQDGISRYWVAGDTWDLLTSALAPGTAPTRPAGDGVAYWVRGSMPIAGDRVDLDPFLDDGDVPSPPPVGSDTTRLTVVPVADDGSPTGPAVPIGLTDVEGAGGSSGPVARQFAQRVVAPSGTAAFRFLLDGALVEQRTLGSAPTVAVDAPAAGTTVARSDRIHVAWTVTDPDTAAGAPAPRIDLLVSDDGGASWRPLASGLSGSSADLAVPRDLGGDDIRVRVVAADGIHLRWADSGSFTVETSSTSLARVAFVAGDRDQEHPSVPNVGTFPAWDRVGTMSPDGGDVRFLDALPAMIHGTTFQLPAVYGSPVWGPDGRIYVAERGGVVSSIEPDGTDLRTEVDTGGGFNIGFDAATMRPCLSMSADGNRMLVNFAVYQRAGSTWTRLGMIGFFSNGTPVTPEWDGIMPYSPSGEVTVTSDQCPVLSPDGEYVARVYDVHGNRHVDVGSDGKDPMGHDTDWYGNELSVAVAPVDAGSPWIARPRFVTAWDETLFRIDGETAPETRQLAVSWSSDHDLLVARGTPGWDSARLEQVDISTLTPHDPDFGPPMVPAATTELSTIALPPSSSSHRAPKPIPGGGVYGDIGCGFYQGASSVTVYHSPYVAGTSTCYVDFAWNGASPSGGTGGGPLAVDPAQAPDPAPPAAPEPAIVSVGPPAPDAGDDATPPAPGAILPASAAIAPGQTIDLRLSTANGVPVRFEVDASVVGPPGGGHISVFGDLDPATGLISTPGALRLTADAATATATGPAELRARIAGDSAFVNIPVEIRKPAEPSATDDALTVQTGVESTFSASALLGNDVGSDPGSSLHLVQVAGYDHGTADLDADGRIHVTATSDGAGTFRYAVAEEGSTAYATATVTVTARSAAVPQVSLNAGSGRHGDRITITGTGFGAGEQVEAVLHSAPIPIGSAAADASGTVTFSWVVPGAAEVGTHRIVLTGSLGAVAERAFEVDPDLLSPPPAPSLTSRGAPLATTGTDSGDALSAALGLVVMGALLVTAALWRRRRRRPNRVLR